MPESIKKNTPNTITCLNLLAGCVSIFMAFNQTRVFGPFDGAVWAMIAMGAAALFDFLDGASARVLHSYSAVGKDLDSLFRPGKLRSRPGYAYTQRDAHRRLI